MLASDAVKQAGDVGAEQAKQEPLGSTLIIVLLATFLQRLAFAVSEVLLVFYLADLVKANIGYTLTEVGILNVALYLTQTLAAPPLGALSDRLGRRTVLLLMVAAGMLATLIPALTSLFALLILNRIVAGAANTGATPAGLALLTDATSGSPARRGRAVALYEGLGLAAQIGGVVLSSILWQTMGQGSFYLAIGLLGLTLLLTAWFMKDSYRNARVDEQAGDNLKVDRRTWLGLLRSRRLWQFAPVWIAANAILGMWYTYTAILLLGSSPNPNQALVGSLYGQTITAGLVFLGYGSIYGAGLAYWSGRVMPGSRMRAMLIASGAAMVVSACLFAFNHAGGAAWAWLLILPAAVGELGESGFVPAALAYLTDLAEHIGGAHDRGAVLGFFGTGNSLGNVLGVVFGLLFIQWWGLQFDGLLLGSAILAAIAFAAAWPLYKEETRQAISIGVPKVVKDEQHAI